MNDILSNYVTTTPNPQNLVDLFKGEWSSKLPSVIDFELQSGEAELFNDQRIMLLNEFMPLQGLRLLELGPLEGGHTYMVHQMGASVLAVEANSRAFLKCLIVKELYHLNNTSFILGDATAFMQNTTDHFDLCLASGVLYHTTHPFNFIELCAKMSDKVFVWTHYYEPDLMKNYTNLNGRFNDVIKQTWQGCNWDIFPFTYQESLNWKGFCGGPLSYSHWLIKQDILDAFYRSGLTKHHVFFDDISHPNGPNICFIAER